MVLIKNNIPTIMTSEEFKKGYESYKVSKATMYKIDDMVEENMDINRFMKYDDFISFIRKNKLNNVEFNVDDKSVLACSLKKSGYKKILLIKFEEVKS